jgi:hypothetical protein
MMVAVTVGSLLVVQSVEAQGGEQLVKAMHTRYKDNWYRTLTFTQETGFYRNDSLLRQSTWYERVRFPYELRIDVDSVNGGNKTIYKKDSTYRIRKGKIFSAAVDPNPFIFFLGGMYMLPLDTVKATLKQNGYDLSQSAMTDWGGRKTLVVGAGTGTDTTRNQFWVDAKEFYIVRILLKSGGKLLDVRLSEHTKLPKGWSETRVDFYIDGKLLQTEKYRDLKIDEVIPDAVFDVSQFR